MPMCFPKINNLPFPNLVQAGKAMLFLNPIDGRGNPAYLLSAILFPSVAQINM